MNPDHFDLDTSWGRSPPDLITFMRMSVLTLEMLVWWSAVVAWFVVEGRRTGRSWRSQVSQVRVLLHVRSTADVD